MDQDRTDTDEWSSRTNGNAVLRALREHNEPVATTSDLATILDVDPDTACRYLISLHEQSSVERKQVGARAVV
jgi:DNA-binding IclR family transcriptional regulator